MNAQERSGISLTEEATLQIRRLVEEEGCSNLYVRFEVKGAGCSGLAYNLFLDDKEIQETDNVFESHGIKIVTNEICLPYLDGTEIGYKKGLTGAGFLFDNPRGHNKCGCGNSFSPLSE